MESIKEVVVKRYCVIICMCFWCAGFLNPGITVSFENDQRPQGTLFLSEARAETDKKETTNFIELHSLYMKWSSGLFGSRKYYRQKVYMHLMTLLDKYIKTGYDYYLESPEAVYDTRLRFVFYNGNWLYIEGNANKESIKEIVGDNPEMLLHWWRTRRLLSVSGRIRRYRIDDWDRKIYVFLDDMAVHELRRSPAEKKNK